MGTYKRNSIIFKKDVIKAFSNISYPPNKSTCQVPWNHFCNTVKIYFNKESCLFAE